MNLCEAQWLAYVLPYRHFAVALTDDRQTVGLLDARGSAALYEQMFRSFRLS